MLDAATYAEKLENYGSRTGLPYLDLHQQQAVRSLASRHRFTFQELREVSETRRGRLSGSAAASEPGNGD